MQKLLHLAFQELGDGDTGPAADHLGDVLLVDLLLDQGRPALLLGELHRLVLELILQLHERAVLQLGRLVQIVFPLGPVDLDLRLLDLLAKRPQCLHGTLFLLPLRLHRVGLGPQIGQLLLELLEAPLGRIVRFFFQGLALDFQLHDPPQRFVQLRGHGVDLGPQLGRRFVHQIDRLVGQEPVGDVAVGQNGRRHQGTVLDAHAVVHLVPLLEPAQDGDGVLDRGLIDLDRLEPSLQRGVLLDVLAIFIQRGGADAVQLAARQHGLEEVAGVHRPFGLARPDDVVQLIDEQNDPTLGFLDLLEDGLEALLELTPILRARDQRPHVQRHDALVLQALGNIAAHDALGQSLHDRRLPDTGLADQHRVVLRAPGQHLDDATDLVVTPDDRIQLPLPRGFGEVAAVTLQRLVGRFRRRRGDALAAAHLTQGLQQLVARDSHLGQQPPGRTLVVGDRQKRVLDRNVFVLELLGFVFRLRQHPVEAAGDIDLIRRRSGRAGDLGHPIQLLPEPLPENFSGPSGLGEDGARQTAFLLEKSGQEMLDINLLVAAADRDRLRRLQRRLHLFGQTVGIHASSSPAGGQPGVLVHRQAERIVWSQPTPTPPACQH